MPYVSKAQRAYLHVHAPAVAARWDREYGGKLPELKRRKRVRRKRS